MAKEVELRLKDVKLVLQPTYAALGRIEQQCGTGLITLAQKLLRGSISLKEIAIIVRECMTENKASSDIEQIIAEGGLAQTMQAVGNLLALVFEKNSGVSARAITPEELRSLQRRFPDQ